MCVPNESSEDWPDSVASARDALIRGRHNRLREAEVHLIHGHSQSRPPKNRHNFRQVGRIDEDSRPTMNGFARLS